MSAGLKKKRIALPSKSAKTGKKTASRKIASLKKVGDNGTRARKLDHDRVSPGATENRSIHKLIASPENDEIYRRPDPTDREFVELVKSVRSDGIREPLVVTLDGFIVSGHRRLAAASAAGLEEVPVRFTDFRRSDDVDRFVRELREFNRQRVKTRSERMREAVIDIDADVCHTRRRNHRMASARVSSAPIDIGHRRHRSEISPAKRLFLAAILRIIHERRRFLPLSVRSIHYALLNDPPLKHANKPRSRYDNTRVSYNALTELVTRARLTGQIPFEAIDDTTRPVTNWDVWRETGEYVKRRLGELFLDFYRDLMQSQPNHVEIVVEKNTVESIIRPLSAEFTIPMTSGRGYCSLPPRAKMAERFERSGRETLIVVFVSDFDPEGEDIAASFARSLRDDFGITDIHPVKAALTADQVKQFTLPPSLKAKSGSSRRAAFVEKHGDDVWELEALPPEQLVRVVRETIESEIDVEAYNAECNSEREDATHLEVLRREAIESLWESGISDELSNENDDESDD